MRRILCTAVALALGTTAAHAQIEENALLGTLNLAYVSAQSEQTGQTTDGVGLNASLEKVLGGSLGSLGFDVTYFQTDESYAVGDETVSAALTAWPITVTGRLFFGKRGSIFSAFLGIGGGIYFGQVETQAGDAYSVQNDSGVVLTVPLGLRLFATKSIFINGGYTLIWMDTRLFKSNLAHTFDLGVGFRFGS